jgi:peptidoglycan LD-endopeptidase LytH
VKSLDRSRPAIQPPRKRSRGGWGGLFFLLFFAVVCVGAYLLLQPEEIPGPHVARFPLPTEYAGSFENDWGAARVQGSHEGTDVFAPEGTPIYAVTGGTVSRAWGSGGDGWNNLGGYTVMIETGYDVGPIRAGDRLYYAHMNAPTKLKPGQVVRAGQKVGEVGDTGQGPPGTRGQFEPHLHLGWYAGGLTLSERSEKGSGAMNPYPLLTDVSGRPLHAEDP